VIRALKPHSLHSSCVAALREGVRSLVVPAHPEGKGGSCGFPPRMERRAQHTRARGAIEICRRVLSGRPTRFREVRHCVVTRCFLPLLCSVHQEEFEYVSP